MNHVAAAQSRLRRAVCDSRMTHCIVNARKDDVTLVLDELERLRAQVAPPPFLDPFITTTVSDVLTPLPITGVCIPSLSELDPPVFVMPNVTCTHPEPPQPTTEGDTAMPSPKARAPFAQEIVDLFKDIGHRLLVGLPIMLIFLASIVVGHLALPEIVDDVMIIVLLAMAWCAYTGAMLARAHMGDAGSPADRIIDVTALNRALANADQVLAEHRAVAADEAAAGIEYGPDGEPEYQAASTEAIIAGLRSYGRHFGAPTDSERLALAAADRLERISKSLAHNRIDKCIGFLCRHDNEFTVEQLGFHKCDLIPDITTHVRPVFTIESEKWEEWTPKPRV